MGAKAAAFLFVLVWLTGSVRLQASAPGLLTKGKYQTEQPPCAAAAAAAAAAAEAAEAAQPVCKYVYKGLIGQQWRPNAEQSEK